MATLTIIEEVLAFLRDCRPAEWDRFKGMPTEEYGRILESWWKVLEPVPDALLVEAAVLHSRKPGAFFPSPGDLFQAALDLRDDSPPEGEAWKAALALACGRTVDLHPLVAEALEAVGGRQELAQANEADNRFYRAQFVKAYQAARERVRERALLDPSRLLM